MSTAHPRILGLDLGDVRIGVAISDSLGITAQPAGTITRTNLRADLRRIVALVEEHEVARIVIGLPLLLSGEEGTRAQGARRFACELRRVLPDLPVDLWDERLSTRQAERVLIAGDVRRRRRKESIDSLAATLILESYMQGQGAGGRPS